MKKIFNKIISVLVAIILAFLMTSCTSRGNVSTIKQNKEVDSFEVSATETVEPIATDAEPTLEAKMISIPATWNISASSSLIPSNSSFKYNAQCAYDGDAQTSWIPGPSIESEKKTEAGREMRYGVNQYLEFILLNGEGNKAEINSISIVNGAWIPVGERNVYSKNNRAKEIRITFDNEYYEDYTLEDGIQDFQTIHFDKTVEASKIRITFLSVYEGKSEFNEHDLMIGEVKIDASVLINEEHYNMKVSRCEYDYTLYANEDNIGVKEYEIYGYSENGSTLYWYQVKMIGCSGYMFHDLDVVDYPETITISVTSLDPKNSNVLWNEQTSTEYLATELGDMGDVNFIDVASNGNLIMAINITDMIVYSSSSGIRIKEDSATYMEKYIDKYIFSMYYGGSINCMDGDGKILWTYFIGEHYQWPTFDIDDEIILVSLTGSDVENKILKLDMYGNVISEP